MRSKRILSLLLTIIMLFTSLLTLFSCAEEQPTEAVSETTDGLSWVDNLPKDLDFSAEEDNTVTFLMWGANTTSQAYRSVDVDETRADAVDKQLFVRNQLVERRLGVDLDDTVHASDSHSLIFSSFMTSVSAGVDDYDVIVGNAIADIYITLQDVLLDLNKLDEYNADYIDLSQPYWPGDYLKEVNYKDKMWWLTGDITTSYLSTMQVIFVNGELYEKYLFGTYGSFYDIVRRGDWTLDMLKEMSDAIFVDKGSEIDKNDRGDINGLLLEHACADIFAVGAGIRFSERDADGESHISIVNNNTISFMEKYFEIKESRGTLYNATTEGLSEVFKSGNGLFIRNSLEFF